MSWLVSDGFEFYSTAINIQSELLANSSVWATISNAPFTTTGRYAGRSLILGNGAAGGSSGITATTISFANSTTFWVNLNLFSSQAHVNGGTTQVVGFTWRDENGPAIQGGFFLRNGGDFVVTTGTAGSTVLATSAVLAPSANVWHHLQVKIVVHPTAGSVELRMDNNTSADFLATGINTRNGTANLFATSISLVGTSPSSDGVDDFYAFNDQGAAPNTWQGEVWGVQQRPNSDVAATWNRNTGTHNFEAVDDTTQDGDSTYVSSNVLNNIDQYGIAPLATEPLTIVGVTLMYMARMDDAGPHAVTARLISGATTDELPVLSLTNNYQIQRKVYPQDPNTNALWAAANVNALNVALRLVL